MKRVGFRKLFEDTDPRPHLAVVPKSECLMMSCIINGYEPDLPVIKHYVAVLNHARKDCDLCLPSPETLLQSYDRALAAWEEVREDMNKAVPFWKETAENIPGFLEPILIPWLVFILDLMPAPKDFKDLATHSLLKFMECVTWSDPLKLEICALSSRTPEEAATRFESLLRLSVACGIREAFLLYSGPDRSKMTDAWWERVAKDLPLSDEVRELVTANTLDFLPVDWGAIGKRPNGEHKNITQKLADARTEALYQLYLTERFQPNPIEHSEKLLGQQERDGKMVSSSASLSATVLLNMVYSRKEAENKADNTSSIDEDTGEESPAGDASRKKKTPRQLEVKPKHDLVVEGGEEAESLRKALANARLSEAQKLCFLKTIEGFTPLEIEANLVGRRTARGERWTASKVSSQLKNIRRDCPDLAKYLPRSQKK